MCYSGIAGTEMTSIVIITGTCIYLRYKIIHSKQFFNSMKKSSAEQERALKVGRLMEILEEQVKPMVSVFIAQGIDAVFNVFAIIIILSFVVSQVNSDLPIHSHVYCLLYNCASIVAMLLCIECVTITFTKKSRESVRRSRVQRKAK